MRDVWKVLLVGVLCYLSTEGVLAHKHYVEGPDLKCTVGAKNPRSLKRSRRP